jgi:hypothetical protein
MWDWPYSLFELNLKNNEVNRIHLSGVNAAYTNSKLFYTSYDGLINNLMSYDIKTKEHNSTEIECFGIPIIWNNNAYYFYEDWSNNTNALFIQKLESEEWRKIDINGSNLTKYYNYLLYIDENANLCAIDVESEQEYCIMPFEGKWIYAVNNYEIYVGTRNDADNIDIYRLKISNDATSDFLFSIIPNKNFDYYQQNKPKLSQLKIDTNWSDLPYAIYYFSNGSELNNFIEYNGNEYYYLYEDNEFALYEKEGSKTKKLIENCTYIEGFPNFIIVNNTIYYYSNLNPGYLFAYNLENNKTTKYETGMGFPIKYYVYNQYLVMDSYYKEFIFPSFDEDSPSAKDLNPVLTIVFNMDTEEITQIENDFLK